MILDKYCPECGFEYSLEFNDEYAQDGISDGFNFCPDCGAKTEWDEEVDDGEE